MGKSLLRIQILLGSLEELQREAVAEDKNSGAALSSLENGMWAEIPVLMVCTPSSHGGHRKAQSGTIPEALGKTGPVSDTVSIPLVIEAQNSSSAQGVVKEM